jgi:hypothetical protein
MHYCPDNSLLTIKIDIESEKLGVLKVVLGLDTTQRIQHDSR